MESSLISLQRFIHHVSFHPFLYSERVYILFGEILRIYSELLTTYTFSSFFSFLFVLSLSSFSFSHIHWFSFVSLESSTATLIVTMLHILMYIYIRERKRLYNAKLCIWQWHQNYVTNLLYTLIWNSFHSFSLLCHLHCILSIVLIYFDSLCCYQQMQATVYLLSCMLVLQTLFHDFYFVRNLFSMIKIEIVFLKSSIWGK